MDEEANKLKVIEILRLNNIEFTDETVDLILELYPSDEQKEYERMMLLLNFTERVLQLCNEHTPLIIRNQNIVSELREIIVKTLLNKVQALICPYGANYKKLQEYSKQKAKNNNKYKLFIKKKHYNNDLLLYCMYTLLMERYGTMIDSIEQIPTSLLESEIDIIYEKALKIVFEEKFDEEKYFDFSQEAPYENIIIFKNPESARKLFFPKSTNKDPVFNAAYESLIQDEIPLVLHGGVVYKNSEFYQTFQRVLSREISVEEAYRHLNDTSFLPREKFRTRIHIDSLYSHKLEEQHIRKNSAESKMCHNFSKAIWYDEHLEYPYSTHVAAQYLYCVLADELIVKSWKNKMNIAVAIYDLLVDLSLLELPKDNVILRPKEKYDRIKYYFKIDKKTGLYIKYT